MTLQITVRGSAARRYPAERATVALAATFDGADKDAVFASAVAVQQPLTDAIDELAALSAVTTWSSDQVRVSSHRPWSETGSIVELVHTATVQVSAEFTDFERLGDLLDDWSGHEGVQVAGITWDVSPDSRRAFEGDVRRAAVADAVAKAQAYADAVGRGPVVAQHLADPGMLAQDSAGAVPMFAKAAFDSATEVQLDLVPREIEIRVEVDARFTAR